jgi:hypothetical protein
VDRTDPTDDNKKSRRVNTLRSQWLNPRGLRFWFVVAIFIYTVVGFLVVPQVLKSSLVGFVQKDLGRSAAVEKIRFNPYTLSLSIEAFEISDTDGVRLISFDRFFVNFELSSLFRWAWTFDEITLTGPYFFFERFTAEENRVSRVLAMLAKDQTTPTEDQDAAGVPRLLIRNLSISDGWAEVKDQVPETPVELSAGPINISISELNTLPDRQGQQTVNIDLPDRARLRWNGTLTLTPFESEGDLALDNLRLDRITPYLKTVAPLNDFSAALSARLHYRIQMPDDQVIAHVDDLDLTIEELAVSGLIPDTEFLSIKSIELDRAALRYPEQIVHFRRLDITEPNVVAWLDQNGALSFAQFFQASKEVAEDPQTDPGLVEAELPEQETLEQEVFEQDALDPDGMTASQLVQTTVEHDSTQQDVLTSSSPKTSPAEKKSWQFALDQLNIDGGSIDFSDQSIEPAGNIGLRNLAVQINWLNNQNGSLFPFTVNSDLTPEGHFDIAGQLGLFPTFSLNTGVTIQAIPLLISEPYVQQSALLSIAGGNLDGELQIDMSADEAVKVVGEAQVSGLDIEDLANKKELMAWQNLTIGNFMLDLQTNNLDISHLLFDQAYGRVHIDANGKANLSELMVKKDAVPANGDDPDSDTTNTAKSSEAAPMQVRIGGIGIEDAAIDFSDLSLPLPFATLIRNLDGDISTVATNSTEPVEIKLEGQVDKFGLARIYAVINLLDPVKYSDIKFEFSNLKMANVSPYSAEFAGRVIDDGNLNMELEYAVNNGVLTGKNNIVLSDLVLGDKVEATNAVSLPLDLAIALLKDSDGVIKANLAVEGDVNDPEFAIGGVIWDAFVTLITKAVSAPFKLLGNLIGLEDDDLGQLRFLAGRADLSPPELEKITHLEEALLQRPKLSIEINGVTNPQIDATALQRAQLDATLKQLLNQGQEAVEAYSLLDKKTRKVLEKLFKERFPDIDLKAVKTAHKVPPADNPEGRLKLDELAYATDLRDRLLISEVIGDQALADLAQARALTVKNALLASNQFDENRVVIAETRELETEGSSDWVLLELSVSFN